MPLTAPPAAPPVPPPAPSRLDDPDTFSAESDEALEHLFGAYYLWLAAFRAWYADTARLELDALQADVAAKLVDAQAAAAFADAAADAAEAAANYKGLWADLAGALAIPATTFHLGQFWALTESVADVAAEVPGTSARWVAIARPPVQRVYTGLSGTWARGATLTGTYTRTNPSFDAVCAVANHGRAVGDYVYLDFTSGSAPDGWYAVASVTDANTFAVTTSNNSTINGNVTVYAPVVVTITSEAAHGLVAAAAHSVVLSGFTSAVYTIRKVTATTFQLDGASALPTALSAALSTAGAGSSGAAAVHSSTRTFTWTKPAGLVGAKFAVASGGGQGRCMSSAGGVSIDGESGGLAVGYFTAAQLGANETITVGAGGFNAAAGANPGQSGSTSSVGALISATGGKGGNAAGSSGTGVGGTLNLHSVPNTSRVNASGQVAAAGGAFPHVGGVGGLRGGTHGEPPPQGHASGGGSATSDGASNLRGGFGTSGIVIVEEFYG